MEIRVLKYFLIAAREENMTKAAELLHVTQPTLSRQIMQLEEELECKLFHRSNHSIYLTKEGMRFKKRAQDIVALEERTRMEFKDKQNGMEGVIAIGSGETKGVCELAQVMKEFQKEYPRIFYDIYTANADDIKERLDKGLVDFGLLTEPADISKYNFMRFGQKEAWGILVPEEWKIAEKEFVQAEDLVELPLIVVSRSSVQKELSGWFGDFYDRMHIVSTYNLINNAVILAKNGLGAVLCMNMNGYIDPRLKFIPLYPSVKTGSVLIWRKNQLLSEISYHFLLEIKKYSEEISENREEGLVLNKNSA